MYIWGVELKTNTDMNKILFSLVFVLFSFPTYVYAQNSQEDLRALIQKVDSLEHELSYLKLSYDLQTLNYDINMFANEVYARSIAIELSFRHQNFDSRLGDMYQGYYEACQSKKESLEGLIDIRKKYFILRTMTYPYSKTELSTLKASYDVIDDAYDTLESSMDLLKVILDAYLEAL